MTLSAQLDQDFVFEGAADAPSADVALDAAHADPLGPLAALVGAGDQPGTWIGHGFNAIWRPHLNSSGQDRFLALNLTDDKIVFSRINGEIPNRGLAMHDINMFGVTYMQQINVAGHPNEGLHIEPGIWAHVPHTVDPAEPPTVVRMASIPHGTSILAQGIAKEANGGPQNIPDNNILPFFFGSPPPANTAFHQVAQTFTELDLSIDTPFRTKPLAAGIDEAVLKNPNKIIQDALAKSLQGGKKMTHRTFLHVSTTDSVIKGGGGTANTAFLATSHTPPAGNAKATRVDATFWIERIVRGGKETLQLQYTQLVMLDFNNIHWPHVTVGTLVKQ